MSALKRSGIARQCGDSVRDHLVVIGCGRLLVADIEVVTADEPDSQHNAGHASSLGAPTPR